MGMCFIFVSSSENLCPLFSHWEITLFSVLAYHKIRPWLHSVAFIRNCSWTATAKHCEPEIFVSFLPVLWAGHDQTGYFQKSMLIRNSSFNGVQQSLGLSHSYNRLGASGRKIGWSLPLAVKIGTEGSWAFGVKAHMRIHVRVDAFTCSRKKKERGAPSELFRDGSLVRKYHAFDAEIAALVCCWRQNMAVYIKNIEYGWLLRGYTQLM